MAYFAVGLPIAILIRLFAGVPLFWFIVIPITILTFIGIAKMDETSILAARKFKDGKSIAPLWVSLGVGLTLLVVISLSSNKGKEEYQEYLRRFKSEATKE